MGTILSRPRKSGGTAYMAKIILKRNSQVIHRETKTFETHRAAKDWIRDREAELSQPGAFEKPVAVTLRVAIDKYMTDSRKQIRRTKYQVLSSIMDHPIAGKLCAEIQADDIVKFAKSLSKDRHPSTVGNYMSHLASVFAVARPAWGYPLDRQAMEDARTVCFRLGITSKSEERDRRPTLDEIERIMNHFERISQNRSGSIPMIRIIAFAIFSTRRQEEITRITWADFEPQNSRVMVRDMKNPGDTSGNDVWCDLPPEAVAIIEAMPRVAAQIFPYTTDAISAAFTRACKSLGIQDLRFHDLRHEGISRLFETGWQGGSIPHVAAVSGHRSWRSLQRYTHVRQRDDKYAAWPWLDIVTKPDRDKPAHVLRYGAIGKLKLQPRSMRSPRRVG